MRGSGGFKDPNDLVGSMNQLLEGLKRELELAEKYESYRAIENHSGNFLLNYLEARRDAVTARSTDPFPIRVVIRAGES